MAHEDKNHRIRLKLPNGAELEAEGGLDFVQSERTAFLNSCGEESSSKEASRHLNPNEPQIDWNALTEGARGGRGGIQLRAKLPGDHAEKDACLVLIAAAEKVLSQAKPSAAQLAKWLRLSGYPILRMDRSLQNSIAKGEILSSGSRRARRYELTAAGRLKAYLLAEQLTSTIGRRNV